MKHRPRHRLARLARLAAALALLCTVARPAAAQTAVGAPAARQACTADYQRFCPDIRPGGGRVRQCLQRNAANLSPGCRTALNAAAKL